MQLFFWGVSNYCATELPDGKVDPNATTILSMVVDNVQAKSKGYVGLRSSNPLDQPKLVGNYLTHPDDVKVIIDGIRIIQKLAQAPIIKQKYNYTLTKPNYEACEKDFKYDTDEYWECAIRYDTYAESHQCASCKMGLASNPEACVNQRLQLYGISNIRIADASAMPGLTSGNIAATVVAIGERASQLIKQQYLNQTGA